MSDEPNNVETQVEGAGNTATEPVTAPAPTAKAEPQQRVVVDPRDGSSYPVTEDEYKSLADIGFATLRERNQPQPETTDDVDIMEDKTITTADDDRVDPVEREMSEVKKQVQEANKTIEELKAAREEDRQKAEQERQALDRQRMIDKLKKETFVDQAEEDVQEIVEFRANKIFQKAIQDRRAVSYEDCYREAAKATGEILKDDKRSWIEGKVKAKQQAGETEGGSIPGAAIELPSLPESKEEQRKLAAEFDNGEITRRAHERFNRLMNAAS